MRRILILCLSLLLCTLASAELRLPDIMSDNMVLQQSSDAAIWGWAEPGAKISASVSWSKAKYSTKSDDSGFWKLYVATPKASFEPQSISLSEQGGSSHTISNILIGEVWFCCGQSNMEMPIKGFNNQPVEGASDAILYSKRYKGVRVASIPKRDALSPQEIVDGKWKCSEPANVPHFSATAYFFATSLSEVLEMPVGIIVAAWGGSWAEGWMSEDLLLSMGYKGVANRAADASLKNGRPVVMYNGMLYPLRHYTIKGFTWYQGCSNVAEYSRYASVQASMVQHWRELWGDESLPFYFVEIAPNTYRDDFNSPRLREAQRESVKIIPHSGIVSTADLVYPYERGCIHPRQKKPVGERLARLALEKTYLYKGIYAEAPAFKSMESVAEGAVLLSFTNVDRGFSYKGELRGFEVAGEDRVFYPATATIAKNSLQIKLSCPEVPEIKAVRYCFHSFELGTIWNTYSQPLMPFRTDDWD